MNDDAERDTGFCAEGLARHIGHVGTPVVADFVLQSVRECSTRLHRVIVLHRIQQCRKSSLFGSPNDSYQKTKVRWRECAKDILHGRLARMCLP